MELPVANAVHPGALARNMPEEPLRMLNHDPFLNECKISGQDNDLIDLVVEGVPGVDTNIEARDKFRRKQRELLAGRRCCHRPRALRAFLEQRALGNVSECASRSNLQ